RGAAQQPRGHRRRPDRALPGDPRLVDPGPHGPGVARGPASLPAHSLAGLPTARPGAGNRAVRGPGRGHKIGALTLRAPGAPCIFRLPIARSSNGRTADSGSVDGGSSPPRATTTTVRAAGLAAWNI